MYDWLIALIPLITSVTGSTIIAKVATGIIGKVAKRNDDKVDLVAKQNKRLEEENRELRERLEANDLLLKECLITEKAQLSEMSAKVLESQKANEETQKLINELTTIRNELRTLLEAEKE